MATITAYETAAGRRWEVRYRKPGGASTRKRGFERRRDAEAWAAQHVTTAIATNTYVAPSAGSMTVSMLWGKYVAAHEGVWKPSHLRTQDSAWRVHVAPVFGERRIASIVPSDVQAWVSSMSSNGASASTVLRAFGVLKGIMEMAQRDRVVAYADCVEHIQLPQKPSGKEDRHYLTPEQLVALAAESGSHGLLVLVLGLCGVRWGEASGLRARDVDVEQLVALAAESGSHGLLVLVLGLCGLRWGEASGLRARDVDVERGVLHVRRTITKVGTRYVEGVPKSWERRDVPVPASLMRRLQAALPHDPDALVFCEADGHALRQQSSSPAWGWWSRALERAPHDSDALVFCEADGHALRQQSSSPARGWWSRALERAGLERMTCHDLRHTAASIAVSSGANVKALQRMLGHKSAAMTLDVYADLFDEDLLGVSTRVDERVQSLL